MTYLNELMRRLKEIRGDLDYRILIIRKSELAQKIGWNDMIHCRIRERRGDRWEIIGAGTAQTLDESLRFALEQAISRRPYKEKRGGDILRE